MAEVSAQHLDKALIAAKATQVTYLINKMRSGKTLTVNETKTLNGYINEREEKKRAEGGRFMTQVAVAKHYGVTTATVARHIKNGNIKPNPDGTFDKEATDAYWCGKLGRQKKTLAGVAIVGGGKSTPTETVGEQYDVERLRKIKAEADAKEYFAEQLQGNLVSIEEVEQFWGARARLCRDLLTSLVDRLPPLIVGLNQHEVRVTVEAEVNSVLKAFCQHGQFTPENITPS